MGPFKVMGRRSLQMSAKYVFFVQGQTEETQLTELQSPLPSARVLVVLRINFLYYQERKGLRAKHKNKYPLFYKETDNN